MLHSGNLRPRSFLVVGLLASIAGCSTARSDVASDKSATPPVVPPKAAKPPEHPHAVEKSSGHSFEHEVRLLFRVAACAGDEPVPPELAATVDAHCEALQPLVDGYRVRYLDRAGPFLATLQPADLPTTVVYPFGGRGLLSALTTYPKLTEVTTLSLEHAGDPRRVEGTDAMSLEDSLERLRNSIRGLLTQSDSTSDSLMDLQRGRIPGQLAFFLIGLAIHEQEPVGLRYFQIESDGDLHYLEEDEIAAIENDLAARLNQRWTSWNPNFSRIRTYLLDHMAFMLSDSTGIPPRYATNANFVQETYGAFSGPFLEANARDSDDFRALWTSQPERPLTFRYGYLDSEKRPHLLVTRRAETR